MCIDIDEMNLVGNICDWRHPELKGDMLAKHHLSYYKENHQ